MCSWKAVRSAAGADAVFCIREEGDEKVHKQHLALTSFAGCLWAGYLGALRVLVRWSLLRARRA